MRSVIIAILTLTLALTGCDYTSTVVEDGHVYIIRRYATGESQGMAHSASCPHKIHKIPVSVVTDTVFVHDTIYYPINIIK